MYKITTDKALDYSKRKVCSRSVYLVSSRLAASLRSCSTVSRVAGGHTTTVCEEAAARNPGSSARAASRTSDTVTRPSDNTKSLRRNKTWLLHPTDIYSLSHLLYLVSVCRM